MHPDDGAKLWCSTIWRGGDAAQSQPVISADGFLYGGARDNDLWAMPQAAQSNPDAQVAWRFHVPHDGDVTAPPVIGADGTIYFASNAIGAGFVYAFAPADAQHPSGTQKWFRQLGGGVHNSSPSLSLDEATVYFSTIDSTVHALDVVDGTERWATTVYPGTNGFRQSNFTIVVGPDGRLYVGARDGLHALAPDAANTGASEAWHFETNGRVESSPALASDGTLYVGASRGSSGTFYAIDAAGHEKWSVALPGKFQNCEAVVGANGTVYVAVGTEVYALSPADGSEIWSYSVPSGKIVAPPVIGAPGVLYVTTLGHQMIAFGAP